MVAQGQAPKAARPDFVEEWLSKRDAKQAAAAAPKAAPDPAAQAKRMEKRREKVAAGLQECALWLRDTVRQGITAPSVASEKHFEGIAGRMVDAQAPGVARRLREMGETVHSGQGWQERLIEQMAHLHLIVEAYARLDTLPEPLREDVLAAVGFTLKKEELPTDLRVADHWTVVGQHRYQEERLSVQRSWLWGRESQRWGMVLAFSVANSPFDPMIAPGSAFRGELGFYPGAEALRALPFDRTDAPFEGVPAHPVRDGLEAFADRLARCPWTEFAPMALGEVRVTEGEVVDAAGGRLPLVPTFEPWRWLALTGGAPATMMGEWDGHLLRPLGLIQGSRWYSL
jgi:hypothetical protein